MGAHLLRRLLCVLSIALLPISRGRRSSLSLLCRLLCCQLSSLRLRGRLLLLLGHLLLCDARVGTNEVWTAWCFGDAALSFVRSADTVCCCELWCAFHSATRTKELFASNVNSTHTRAHSALLHAFSLFIGHLRVQLLRHGDGRRLFRTILLTWRPKRRLGVSEDER